MTASFDFESFKTGLERSDAEAVIAAYADDARMTIVDRNRPPSDPMVLEGRAQIEPFWRDVCARDMTHKVGREVLGDGRVAFVEECAYPDGCNVMSSMTLGLRDGRIVEHLTVQAWDEVSCATS